MNILDKIRCLLWIKSLFSKMKDGGGKMSNFMQKLDGYKSIFGLLIVVAYYVVPMFVNVKIPDFILKFGLGLASAGLAHKLEKATGVISKALDGIKSALEAITAEEKK